MITLDHIVIRFLNEYSEWAFGHIIYVRSRRTYVFSLAMACLKILNKLYNELFYFEDVEQKINESFLIKMF